ncbi:MAG: hypothetical protein OXI95_11870 [bacterium]|nr:hypothetical protein [bacterium]MDE0417618.1 hypothetical protein [bacterium]
MTDRFDPWREREDVAERLEIALDRGARMIAEINRALTTALRIIALLAALAAGVVLQAEFGIVPGTAHAPAGAVENAADRQREALPWLPPDPAYDASRGPVILSPETEPPPVNPVPGESSIPLP